MAMRMDDERLDAAIDDVARQMMAAEPRADFRAHVMANLETRRRFVPFWRPAVAGLSIAALIAIAVIVSRDRPQPDTQPHQSAPVATSPQTASQWPEVGLETSRPVRVKAATPYIDLPGAGNATRIEPLTPFAIDLQSIAVAALPAEDSLAVAPLQPVASIAVAPLDADDQGDRR